MYRKWSRERYHREQSEKNIHAMDLTCFPPPERFPFDAYAAGQILESEAFKLQGQLETMAFVHPGRYRYALQQMIKQPRYLYRNYGTELLWTSYARRVFDAAIEQNNGEACAIVMLTSLARFAERVEKRRRRSEQILRRTPEARSASAKKAAITRKTNMVERKEAKTVLAGADSAMGAVFASIDALMTDD